MTSLEGNDAERTFVSLAWIGKRWSCSRQTVRRVLHRAGVQPLYLGDARNATVRYALEDVLAVEEEGRGHGRDDDRTVRLRAARGEGVR